MNVVEQFWSQVDKSGECWEWQGAYYPPSKYGYFNAKGLPNRAHRASWVITYGYIESGLWDDPHVRIMNIKRSVGYVLENFQLDDWLENRLLKIMEM